MSIIDQIQDPLVWESFYCHKVGRGNISSRDEQDLKSFILNEEYGPVVSSIKNGTFADIPTRKSISKQHTSKKRIVYTYDRDANYVLKLLTHLLIRKYDYLFTNNLYSFRANRSVRNAIDFLRHMGSLSEKYVYKADIHDYFNSVDIELLLPELQQIMADEPDTFSFVQDILTNKAVRLENGEVVDENKGIMAGTPISSFLANVYLAQLDRKMMNSGYKYARYSDDVIVFSTTSNEREEAASLITNYIANRHLSINPDKVQYSEPHKQWTFLGISYQDGIFDVSPVSATKLKKKMWRKSRALLRWKNKKGADNTRAAKAFIKVFNKKLYDNNDDSELTWTRWFFPMINTSKTLHDIDLYMQDCIRYIQTGSRTKKRFECRYADLKALGYKSLVHEYYTIKNTPEK